MKYSALNVTSVSYSLPRRLRNYHRRKGAESLSKLEEKEVYWIAMCLLETSEATPEGLTNIIAVT